MIICSGQADLWSLGVILYEALFGRAPFSSDSLETLVVKIKEDVPIVIPNHAKISSECRDLLSRCLVRCPEKRIDFSDFFSHPFLDLEHLPDENSFQKASLLVTQAVTADRDKDCDAAVRLYEESLKYFLPLIHYETDVSKREKLKVTVSGYQKRCRELKYRNVGSSKNSSKHQQLIALCRTSSNLMTGVEICVQGEDYLAGGEYEMALDRMTSGLGVLVPALQHEPRGVRRDILRREVTSWMESAEKLKQNMNNDDHGDTDNTVDDAAEASEDKKSCKMQ